MCGFLLLTLKTSEISDCNQDAYADSPLNTLTDRLVSSSSEFLKYRGKEQENHYCIRVNSNKILFSYHSRLLTIGEEQDGHQPVVSQEHISVFNGAVYNYLKIAKLLGITPTSSDTDTICKQSAFIDYWKKFNGPFAIAQYSINNDSIDIGRDLYGEKPLFYYSDEKLVIASSSALLITKLLIDFSRLDRNLIGADLLKASNQPNLDYTWFGKSIKLLQPGRKVRINDNGLDDIDNYSEQISKRKVNLMSSDQLSTLLIDTLSSSLEERSKAHGKVGLALSGGLDSSLLLAVARNIGLTKLQCFTTSYKSQQSCIDESLVASQYSHDLGYEHFSIEPDADFFLANVDPMLRVLEAPPENSLMSSFSLYYLMQSHSIRISLEGQGADEIFSGYTAYIVNYLRDANFLNAPFAAIKFAVNNKSPMKSHFLAYGLAALLASSLYSAIPESLIAWFSSQIAEGQIKKNLSRLVKTKSLRDQLAFDIEFNLQKLLMYGDKHSLLFNIEQRFPFLDKNVENVSRLAPTSLLFSPSSTKSIIRNACRALNVPSSILKNKRKFGWDIPEYYWYTTSNDFRAWLSRNSESSLTQEIVNSRLKRSQFRAIFRKAIQNRWACIQFSRLGLNDNLILSS